MVAKTKKAEPAPVVGPFGGNAQQRVVSLVERIERLNEERDTIGEDLKEVYTEAKGEGFDTATLRAVIQIRRMDPAKRAEKMALIDVYLLALGGFDTDGHEFVPAGNEDVGE